MCNLFSLNIRSIQSVEIFPYVLGKLVDSIRLRISFFLSCQVTLLIILLCGCENKVWSSVLISQAVQCLLRDSLSAVCRGFIVLRVFKDTSSSWNTWTLP